MNKLLLFIFTVVLSGSLYAQNYYVTPTGNGSGTSWDDPISLTAVLNNIRTNTSGTYNLYMKQGTYTTTSTTIFTGSKQVNFIGGYDGTLTGSDLCANDPVKFKTQLNNTANNSSMFLLDNANTTSLLFDGIYYNNTTINGGSEGTFIDTRTDASNTTVTIKNSLIEGYSSVDPTFIYFDSCDNCDFVADNAHVTGGTPGDTGNAGGFFRANNSSDNVITIKKSTFTGNSLNGSGVASSLFTITGGSGNVLDVDDSFFCSNVNSTSTGSGAVFRVQNVDTDIDGSKFFQNEADLGGVIHVSGGSSTTDINTSEFSKNKARTSGGVVYIYGVSGTTTLANNYFDRNSAEGTAGVGTTNTNGGGALFYRSNGLASNNDKIYVNFGNKFYANSAASVGGAILIDARINTDIKIEGCLFENNSAGESGGAIKSLDEGTTARGLGSNRTEEIEAITNSSFYGNAANGQTNTYAADIDLDAREDDSDLPRTWTAVGVLDNNKLQLPVKNGQPTYTGGPNPMLDATDPHFYFPYDEGGWGGVNSEDEGFLVVTNNTQQTTPLGLAPLTLTCPTFSTATKICTGSISGTVLEDTTKDGVGDKPMEGVELALKYPDSMPVMYDHDNDPSTPEQAMIVQTNALGKYIFPVVPVGDYLIVQAQPNNYSNVSDSQSSDGDTTGNINTKDNIIPVTVTSGENDESNNFVEIKTSALPIRLASFAVEAAGQDAVLIWVTSSEVNNDRFEIERSYDGKSFKKVGEVSGKGTSTEVNTYNYTDVEGIKGGVYYRLRQVDFDGAFDYSDVVYVEGQEYQYVSIYPNPVVGDYINVSGVENGTFEIYDVTGKLLNRGNVSNTIDVSTLNTGVYVLRISNADGEVVLIEKVVKY